MDRWPRPMRRDAASSALLEFRLKIKDSRIFSFLGFDDIGNRKRGEERERRGKGGGGRFDFLRDDYFSAFLRMIE